MKFQGKFHRLHRVIWLMHCGTWPSMDLDHINGIRSDNRIGNLREVTMAQNCWNKASRPDAAVYWHATNKRWTVSMGLNGKLRHFGSFKDKADAEAVARQAIKEHRGEYARQE